MIVWVNVSVTQSLPLPQQGPKDVIEELWGMAVRGGLLTPKGWKRAGAYFADTGLSRCGISFAATRFLNFQCPSSRTTMSS